MWTLPQDEWHQQATDQTPETTRESKFSLQHHVLVFGCKKHNCESSVLLALYANKNDLNDHLDEKLERNVMFKKESVVQLRL